MTDTVTPLNEHPAKFSEPILDRLRVLLTDEARRLQRSPTHPLVVVDPFAGVGRIHSLMTRRIRTIGIELQPRWAACRPYRPQPHGWPAGTVTGDMFYWLPRIEAAEDQRGTSIDVIATSPTYGNRLSDHHAAGDGSTRHSYTHTYGQELEPNNSGVLPWGPRYWAFTARAYRAFFAALPEGGLFLLNVSKFYRRQELVHAVEWHLGAAYGAGFVQDRRPARIVTKRLQGVGAEATAARADHEVILRLRKPPTPTT